VARHADTPFTYFRIYVVLTFGVLSDMDDCNLKSLKVKPGELSPVFKSDAVEYKVTVGSKVNAVTILCETSDKGASVSISASIIFYGNYFRQRLQAYRAALYP